MKADYVHKDTLTATDYVELNKNNELLMSYNQALLKENQQLQNNWNELKEYCKNNYYGITTVGILEKMQELEGNK